VPDEKPPVGLNYETWLGPAPKRPYNRNRINRWRWYRDYGNGEMGDDGIHDIDLAVWGLGVDTLPVKIEAHKWYRASVKVRLINVDDPTLSVFAQVARHYLVPAGPWAEVTVLQQLICSDRDHKSKHC